MTFSRVPALVFAALMTVAAAFSVSATFSASAPGADLEPVGDANRVVELIQGQQHLLWSSLTGKVTPYTVIGWPSTQGDAELGGALTIERPADGTAGVIAVAEKPMTVNFAVDQ